MRPILRTALYAAAALIGGTTAVATARADAPAPSLSAEETMACEALFLKPETVDGKTILDRYIAAKKLSEADEARLRSSCAVFASGAAFVIVQILSQPAPDEDSEEEYNSGVPVI